MNFTPPLEFSKNFEAEVMKWYRELPVHKKIDLKQSYFPLICGAGWSDVNFIIDIKTRLCIFYYKMIN